MKAVAIIFNVGNVFERTDSNDTTLRDFRRSKWTLLAADNGGIIARHVAFKGEAGTTVLYIEEANASAIFNATAHSAPLCMYQPTLIDMGTLELWQTMDKQYCNILSCKVEKLTSCSRS